MYNSWRSLWCLPKSFQEKSLKRERAVTGASNYFCTGIFLARNISLTQTHIWWLLLFPTLCTRHRASQVRDHRFSPESNWVCNRSTCAAFPISTPFPHVEIYVNTKTALKPIGFMKQRNDLAGAGHCATKESRRPPFLLTEFVRIVLTLQCVIHPRSWPVSRIPG